MLRRLKQAVRNQPLLRAGVLRAGGLVRSLAFAEPGVYTLCYHHVAAGSATGFAAQIAFLRRHGSFIDAETAARRLEAGGAGQDRAFVLTLDDGYADNLHVALPVLRAARVPAMLFLVSDWLETPPGDRQAYLDRDGVRRWLNAGLSIGSHSATHARFSRLSRSAAVAELERSAADLAALQGAPVQHFACPWGVAGADFLPERDTALAAGAGYRTFFTTRRGVARGPADLMAMPRHVLEPEWPTYQLAALMGGRKLARA